VLAAALKHPGVLLLPAALLVLLMLLVQQPTQALCSE
jgi:hypothetical protein